MLKHNLRGGSWLATLPRQFSRQALPAGRQELPIPSAVADLARNPTAAVQVAAVMALPTRQQNPSLPPRLAARRLLTAYLSSSDHCWWAGAR
jgi:hypothetical protein